MIAVHFALDSAIEAQPAAATGFEVEGLTNLGIDFAGARTSDATIRVASTCPEQGRGRGRAWHPANETYGGDAFRGGLRVAGGRRARLADHPE
jgi:serralysin